MVGATAWRDAAATRTARIGAAPEQAGEGAQVYRRPDQGAGETAAGTAADCHIDQEAAVDALCRRPSRRAFAGFDRRAGTSDAARRVQHHPEADLSRVESLQRSTDALHAAHHLVWCGD